MANSVHSMSSELKQTKFFLELEDGGLSMTGAFRGCRGQSSCMFWGWLEGSDDGKFRLHFPTALPCLDSISLQDLRSFIVPFSSDFTLLF
jgi:hypothetical protein